MTTSLNPIMKSNKKNAKYCPNPVNGLSLHFNKNSRQISLYQQGNLDNKQLISNIQKIKQDERILIDIS